MDLTFSIRSLLGSSKVVFLSFEGMGAKKAVRFDLETESDAICQLPRTMWVYFKETTRKDPPTTRQNSTSIATTRWLSSLGGKKPRVGTGTGSVPGTGRR